MTLMAVLTACGDGDDDGGSSGQGVIGGAVSGGQKSAPALSSGQQVSQALPSAISLPGEWRMGKRPLLIEGTEVASTCQQVSGTACTGVQAAGRHRFSRKWDGSAYARAEFSMYAFDAPDNAKVVFTALARSERDEATGDVKELKVNAGADESDSFADDDGPQTMMRVGGVLVQVRGVDVDGTAELEKLATIQVERIKKVAAGENPDA
ncbi:hypothetical protein [Streptomyces sp. NPDC003032]